MSVFFDAIKLLFPRSRAFNLTIDSNKRKLIKAIAVLPENMRHEMEQVYFDMFPETSRCIDDWEKVFAVVFSSKELAKQRNVLAALWRINKPVSNPRQRSITNVAVCGNKKLCCKNAKAVCGYRIGDEGFSPTILRNDVSELYSIKNDRRFWVYCYFICKSVVRNNKNEILYIEKLQIKKEFRNYIEYLILKIKPVHTVAVMFIEWV